MKEEFVKNKQTNKTRDQPMPMYGLISVLFWKYIYIFFKSETIGKIWN